MNKLTKKQKLEAYIYVYYCNIREFSHGVCVDLREWAYEKDLDLEYNLNYNEFAKKYFPEFYAQKPEPFYEVGLWWRILEHDSDQRPEAILKAIELLYE